MRLSLSRTSTSVAVAANRNQGREDAKVMPSHDKSNLPLFFCIIPADLLKLRPVHPSSGTGRGRRSLWLLTHLHATCLSLRELSVESFLACRISWSGLIMYDICSHRTKRDDRSLG